MSSKNILVTGASSGIGAELAKVLARSGHRLVLTARRLDRLEALANECRHLGAEVAVLAADLADTSCLESLIADAMRAFGGIDVLVNNAGYGLGTTYAESTQVDIVNQLNVNLVSPILLTRFALPGLIDRRGTIINVGSSLSAMAIPLFGVYGTTKAGMAYWNDSLRREVGRRGVSVCLVEPGPVATEFLTVVEGSAARPLNGMEARPPAFLNARADDAARRIARLIERPKRRISMLQRTVLPLRWLGGLFRLFPALGDRALSVDAPPRS